MAGSITLGDGQSWSVASWVFDHVLRQSISLIPPNFERLNAELNEVLLEGRLDYLDLRTASKDERRAFLVALQKGLARTETEGSESFSDPTFYPGFIARFKELIELVSANVED
jgi:hypothetical protein